MKEGFSLRRKTFLETREKRIYNITNFLWENKISELFGYDYGYESRQTV